MILRKGEPVPPPPLKNKINPLWLVDDIYRPEGYNFWAWLWRQKIPQNFCAFVIGVQHKDHYFSGSKNSEGIFAEYGWNFGFVKYKFIYLPLISHKGKKWEKYIGWRPIGAFGFAFRVSGAKSWDKTD